MKTPKYTDLHRYPNGWKPSQETNVTETWDRAKREHERAKERERLNAEERLRKTIQWRKAK